MQVTPLLFKMVVSGDIRIDVCCDDDGSPDSCEVSVRSTGTKIYNGPVNLLEQAAAVIAALRMAAGDERSICRVCPEHGYQDSDSACPRCASADWVEG